MKKFLLYFLLLATVAYIGCNVYLNRARYFSSFDVSYWKNKYEQSQWKLPRSVRTIGDDGLYLFEGYRLVHGGDPSLVNAEVPLLGKYLIGLSIVLFGNGYWYGLFTTILVCLLAALIVYRVTHSVVWTTITGLLILTDPLVTSQLSLSMLDSLQMAGTLAYLAALHFIYNTHRKKAPWMYVATGLLLGLASSIKAPIFTPLLFLMGIVAIGIEKKQRRAIALFIIGSIVGYFVPYTGYFLHGHTIIDWIKLQKWLVMFYTQGIASSNIGTVFPLVFFNSYRNIFTHAVQTIPEWSFTWPFITVLGSIGYLVSLVLKKGKEKHWWMSVSIFIIATIITNALIPFWPRYLISMLPFFYIGCIILMTYFDWWAYTGIIIGLLCINIATSYTVLFPTPEATVKQFMYDWSNGFFQDMYEHLSHSAKKTMSRDEFFRFGKQIMNKAEIESLYVTPTASAWMAHADKQFVALDVTANTRHLGPFSHSVIMTVVKENDQWAIEWNWKYLLPGLSETALPETTVQIAKRGAITASDKKPISYDFPSYMIEIIPEKVDHEQEPIMLETLQKVFHDTIQATAFHERYAGNTLPDEIVPIGVIPHPIDELTKQKLLSFPGVSLTPHIGRFQGKSDIKNVGSLENAYFFECCSYLYSTSLYHGKTGTEKEKDELLRGTNGGTLVIKDSTGRIVRTLIQAEKKDGKDAEQ